VEFGIVGADLSALTMYTTKKQMLPNIRKNLQANTPAQCSKAKTDLEVKSTFQCISLLILGNVTAGAKNLSP
jgi:hypothetical protein